MVASEINNLYLYHIRHSFISRYLKTTRVGRLVVRIMTECCNLIDCKIVITNLLYKLRNLVDGDIA